MVLLEMVLLQIVLLEMVLLEMVILFESVCVIDCIEQVEGLDVVAIHR